MRSLALAGCFLASAAHAQVSDVTDGDAYAEELRRGEIELDPSAVYDPWEGFNRKMFAVHNAIDGNVLAPAAKAYRTVTHKKQRKGIRNLLANLRTPVILINDLLQGEFERAGETASRFVINSTIGFGGMGDPAERIGIPQHSEDFGQTLAVWGIDTGPFLFLPLFGPSNLRDGFGAAAGLAADPSLWIHTEPARLFRFTRTGVSGLSTREPLIEPLQDIEKTSLDYYASLRSFYLQARRREIANGQISYEDLPDIGEFEEFEELE
jgi:phospholipid-binding lipoprotein MlaA